MLQLILDIIQLTVVEKMAGSSTLITISIKQHKLFLELTIPKSLQFQAHLSFRPMDIFFFTLQSPRIKNPAPNLSFKSSIINSCSIIRSKYFFICILFLEMNPTIWRRCLAECLGVFILCSFGNGSVAQAQTFTGGLTNFLGINFTYGNGIQ